MSEFDKIVRITNGTNHTTNNQGSSRGPGPSDRVLMSGESTIQDQLFQMYIGRRKCGKIILMKKRDYYYMEALRRIPNTVIIQNESGSKNYHPFAGHSETEIYEMLCSMPSAGNVGNGLRLLLKYFSKLLVLDENLIELIAREGCDLFVLEDQVESLCQRNVLTEREGQRLMNHFESLAQYFVDLEVMLDNLLQLARISSTSLGFRVSYSIKSCIEQNRNMVFVFDGSLRSTDGYDRMLLSLLSADAELSLKNTQKKYCFMVDDLKYQYLSAFEWIFSEPGVTLFVNLHENADYYTNQYYSQLVRSKFEDYLIFTHKNIDMCRFWSNSFGSARTVEYNYSNSNTTVTRYPMLPVANGLFGMQQHSEVTGYHYVDKNIHQEYEIRDLRENELFYFIRSQNRISRHTL